VFGSVQTFPTRLKKTGNHDAVQDSAGIFSVGNTNQIDVVNPDQQAGLWDDGLLESSIRNQTALAKK
jgi:hypothetical protein